MAIFGGILIVYFYGILPSVFDGVTGNQDNPSHHCVRPTSDEQRHFFPIFPFRRQFYRSGGGDIDVIWSFVTSFVAFSRPALLLSPYLSVSAIVNILHIPDCCCEILQSSGLNLDLTFWKLKIER